MPVKTVGVLGLGIFGSSITKELSKYDCDIIAVDINEDNLERIEPYATQAVKGNIVGYDFLESIGLANCDVAIIATGENLEASALAVMNCKKLGIETVVAKAKNKNFMAVLRAVGATRIISPEKEMGVRVAKQVLQNRIKDIVNLDDEYSVVEFDAPSNWSGKSIQQLDLRKRYEINIIGIRDTEDSPLTVAFKPDYVIKENDILVGVTESNSFEQKDYLNKIK